MNFSVGQQRKPPGGDGEQTALRKHLNRISTFQILSYTGGQTHRYGDPTISSRFQFTGDPKVGDASIAISDARVSDTATYQCKVKKAPGMDTHKLTLMVMGEELLSLFGSTGFTCRAAPARRVTAHTPV